MKRMKYDIIKKPDMIVAGIAIKTTNQNQQAAQDMPALWQRFLSSSAYKQDAIVCAYTDYESDYKGAYRVVLGHQCEKRLDSVVIPASTYAVFSVHGAYPQSLLCTWQWIWNSDLARTYTGDFELYPAGFFDDPQRRFEVYVAIR